MRQGDAMDKMNTQEIVSALADGQLHGEEFARGVQAVVADPQARQAWQTYHLIGDVLRSGHMTVGVTPAAFMDGLAQRLAREPLATNSIAAHALPARAEGQFHARKAANDGSFRWKLVAGFASLTAVAAIGWTVAGGLGAKPEQAQLAGVPAQPPVVAGSEQGPMIRDARLDELLAAHRQFGGASALPTPAGFLRNATFEGPAR
jgi:sigma-E factor negative regulatory protein RseA